MMGESMVKIIKTGWQNSSFVHSRLGIKRISKEYFACSFLVEFFSYPPSQLFIEKEARGRTDKLQNPSEKPPLFLKYGARVFISAQRKFASSVASFTKFVHSLMTIAQFHGLSEHLRSKL